MTVRVRGIYTTALTALLRAEEGVVQASPPIRDRFDASFPDEPADATVTTTDDRQGVGVVGDPATVESVVDELTALGRDALSWADPAPRGAVFAGEVTDTLGGGAVVALGEREGFLPYSKTSRRIEDGDRLRVQVNEPAAPWTDGRPVLDTTVRVQGTLGTLVRGGDAVDAGGPSLTDVIAADPRDGWGVTWSAAADDADLDALGEELEALNERAAAVDDALTAVEPPADAAPARYAAAEATTWVWFGRETRFELDERRRAVVTTMPGHHRIKAGSRSASAAVDFVEALAGEGAPDDGPFDLAGDDQFPFAVTARQFGPQPGDHVAIEHGKPDGRCFSLGTATVESVDPDGTVELSREMTAGGTYDALGVERRAGDVATTKVREGRWWYPTVYESADGERRGTYVNVCTPVEVFPDGVRYVDLHVDVVRHPDGTVERVDDDELDDAVDAGYLSEALAEKARSVAASVVHGLE